MSSPLLRLSSVATSGISIVELGEFQRRALETKQYPLDKPEHASAAAFGLVQATGSIAQLFKKHLYKKLDLGPYRDFLRQELGDLLWYTAIVAGAFKLDLEDIAQRNLEITHNLYSTGEDSDASLRSFDDESTGCPATQRFPRRLVFRFEEVCEPGSGPTARITILEASPNAFPDGPEKEDGKIVAGFKVGEQLGDDLTDNSQRPDGYRFHDAIHMGFLAVLGWSPILRRLLKLKRKYAPSIDENQDGARAAFAEEGLAHILARLAEKRQNFQAPESVDGITLEVFGEATAGLEVNDLPRWLWKNAISSAFVVLRQLDKAHGGYVIADLDKRSLTFREHYP